MQAGNRRWLLHRVDEPFRSQERGSRLCLWLPRDKAWVERTRRALLRERIALFALIPIFRFEKRKLKEGISALEKPIQERPVAKPKSGISHF